MQRELSPQHVWCAIVVLAGLAFLGALVLSQLLPIAFLVASFPLPDPELQAAREHYERARQLEADGEWESALSEYGAARELRWNVEYLHGMARCAAELGEYERALALFDEAIGDGRWVYDSLFERASCTEEYEGVDAAVAWLESLAVGQPPTKKVPYLIGCHHWRHDRPGEAIPQFHRAHEIVMDRQRVAFDDELKLGPSDRIAEMTRNELADLAPMPAYLAQCYEQVGDLEEAYAWATRGISLHTHIGRRIRHRTPEAVEAGDTACRLVRARVHMGRAEWAEAEREIDHAAAFIDGWSRDRVAEARAQWQRRREL